MGREPGSKELLEAAYRPGATNDVPRTKPRFLFAGGVVLIFGLAVAGLMMSAAWDHNPQGEFHEIAPDGTTIIHWPHWLLIGVSWFLPAAGAAALAIAGLFAIGHVLHRLVGRR